MKMCANCHKPIGLNAHALPRYWDWRALVWRVFHHRDCKREWLHKRQQDIEREKAVSHLYHPP